MVGGWVTLASTINHIIKDNFVLLCDGKVNASSKSYMIHNSNHVIFNPIHEENEANPINKNQNRNHLYYMILYDLPSISCLIFVYISHDYDPYISVFFWMVC